VSRIASHRDFALLHDPRVGAMRRDRRVSRDVFRVAEKT
jgi:hypothetical protein